jgi:hypothetical protein
MNTAGAVGAAVVAWSTGTIIQLALAGRASALDLTVDQLSASDKHAAVMSGYDTNFLTYFAAYVISALCWRFIDSERPVVS